MVDPGSEWEDASLIVGVAVRVVALDAYYVGVVVRTRAEDRARGARPEAYAKLDVLQTFLQRGMEDHCEGCMVPQGHWMYSR